MPSTTLPRALSHARDWATAGPFRAGVVVALAVALVALLVTASPIVAAAAFGVSLPIALIGTYAVDTVRVWRDWLGGPDSPLADRRGGRRRAATDTRAQLVRLRERYVEGELDERQFERKVATLLGTDTPEAARDHLRRSRGQSPGGRRSPRPAPEQETGADTGAGSALEPDADADTASGSAPDGAPDPNDPADSPSDGDR